MSTPTFEERIMATKEDSLIFNQYYIKVLGTDPNGGITDYSRQDRDYETSDTIDESGDKYLAKAMDEHFGIDKMIKDRRHKWYWVQEKAPEVLGYGTIVHPYKTKTGKDRWHESMAGLLSVGYPNAQRTGFDLWVLVTLQDFRDYVESHGNDSPPDLWIARNRDSQAEFIRVPIMSVLMDRPQIIKAISYTKLGMSVLLQQLINLDPGVADIQSYNPLNPQILDNLHKNNQRLHQWIAHQGAWIKILAEIT